MLGHGAALRLRTWLSRSPLADVTDSVLKLRLSAGGSIESETRPEGLRVLADPGSCGTTHAVSTTAVRLRCRLGVNSTRLGGNATPIMLARWLG